MASGDAPRHPRLEGGGSPSQFFYHISRLPTSDLNPTTGSLEPKYSILNPEPETLNPTTGSLEPKYSILNPKP
jgi:hypothetical protein